MVSDMGPVFVHRPSCRANSFASVYVSASGLVFISIVGVAFAPFIHRFYHYFHYEPPESDSVGDPSARAVSVL